jgi:hypothetical protein
MPIEIKELVVRIVVQEKSQNHLSALHGHQHIPVKEIVEECVEKVLEQLEAKMER